MVSLEVKNLTLPDETRPFVSKGKAEVVILGGRAILRGTFEPGWRWSEHVRPLARTDSCMVSRTGYVVTGRMHIRMNDGAEGEIGPGDAFVCAPGYDAWTVGDEACTIIDLTAGGTPS